MQTIKGLMAIAEKQYIFLFIILLIGFCVFLARPQEKGIKELIQIQIPNGYTEEKNSIYDKGRLVSVHYGNGSSSVYLIILSHNGKAVMGSDETLKDWCREKEITDTLKVNGIKMYICPLNKNSPESEIRAKSVIESVFEFNGYMIMVGMSGNEGVQLTKKDIITFYDMLDTLRKVNSTTS